jgi:hypothetical protein
MGNTNSKFLTEAGFVRYEYVSMTAVGLRAKIIIMFCIDVSNTQH